MACRPEFRPRGIVGQNFCISELERLTEGRLKLWSVTINPCLDRAPEVHLGDQRACGGNVGMLGSVAWMFLAP